MKNIRIIITRGSVAVGDDIDAPHEKVIEMLDTELVEEIINAVYEQYSLPRIFGGKASWSIISNAPLAVVAQQWSAPKILNKYFPINKNKLAIQGDGSIRVHFNYHSQVDPDTVFNILQTICNASHLIQSKQ